MSTKLHLSAMIMIAASEGFEQFVHRLANSMPGIAFTVEDSGRYEEIPAYEAKAGEMEFLLLGIPEEDIDHEDEYRLEFSCTTQASIAELVQRPECIFAGQFIRDKPLNSRGFLDYSQELSDFLTSRGIEGCKPVIMGD